MPTPKKVSKSPKPDQATPLLDVVHSLLSDRIDESPPEWQILESQLGAGGARLREAGKRYRSELQGLMDGLGITEQQATDVYRSSAMIDQLAIQVASLMGWEHGDEALATARANVHWDGKDAVSLWDQIWSGGPDYGISSAYVKLCEARDTVRGSADLASGLQSVAIAAGMLLSDVAEKRQKVHAVTAAKAGWEWLTPVQQFAFTRFAEVRAIHPARKRTPIIKAMLPEVRALYDKHGAKHGRALSPDEINAFRTVESWFKDAGIK